MRKLISRVETNVDAASTDQPLETAMQALAKVLGVDRQNFDPERLMLLANDVADFASNTDRTDDEVAAYISEWPPDENAP